MHNRYMRDTTTHAHAYDFSALPCDRSASCLCIHACVSQCARHRDTCTRTAQAAMLHTQAQSVCAAPQDVVTGAGAAGLVKVSSIYKPDRIA